MIRERLLHLSLEADIHAVEHNREEQRSENEEEGHAPKTPSVIVKGLYLPLRFPGGQPAQPLAEPVSSEGGLVFDVFGEWRGGEGVGSTSEKNTPCDAHNVSNIRAALARQTEGPRKKFIRVFSHSFFRLGC